MAKLSKPLTKAQNDFLLYWHLVHDIKPGSKHTAKTIDALFDAGMLENIGHVMAVTTKGRKYIETELIKLGGQNG